MSSEASSAAGSLRARTKVPAAGPGAHGDPISAHASDPERINILIVDDEPKNLTVLESVLNDPAYRLVHALSAQDALLALIADEFALLILDVQMPEMTGFELAEMVKQRKKNAHVPIIFLTAYYDQDEHVLEGYGTGAVDYLVKPVNAAALRSKVAVFAELYRQSHALEIANRALREEVATRRRIQEELHELNETLEKRVTERTERLRQLADSMPQMVWTARPDGYLDYFNARWYEFTGFSPDDDGDVTKWEALLFPDDLPPFHDDWARSVQSGEPYRAEYRLWDRHANRYCWYLGRALPIRDEDGCITKWIGTSTDIDEQKRSQQNLLRANGALEQFAFAASHDLQEPLRNIAIYTQLFAQRYEPNLNDETSTFLRFITEGAQRMTRLVSDLLAYTQVVSQGKVPAANADAESVMRGVLENLTKAIEESRATITRDRLPQVSMKDVHLGQLLQNLIGNAIKYRREDVPPEVHVSVQQEDDYWHFAVKDNGIGIDPQYGDLIFGIFKRLHTKGEKYEGSGMGLAICRRIVDNYGGRIWIESAEGRGAIFHFTVPRAEKY
jgi:PAS domain S-box-containing protein